MPVPGPQDAAHQRCNTCFVFTSLESSSLSHVRQVSRLRLLVLLLFVYAGSHSSLVYFSFLLLMVSIYVSFFTYSQIWFVEAKNSVALGGKSNRAVLFFQQEFRQILKRSINIRS